MNSRMKAAKLCITANSKQAIAISFVPFISIPLVHGICIKMIMQLNKIFGIPTDKRFGSEIFNDILTGIVMTPAMAIPVLGAGVAHTYIKSIGEYYAQAVATVLDSATKDELENRNLIADKIKNELENIHNQRRAQYIARRKSQEEISL